MTGLRSARDRAAQWIIAREQPGWAEEDQEALDAWLGASDVNKAAFWRLEHSWAAADRIGALGAQAAGTTWEHVTARRWRGWHTITALAASIAAVAGAGIYGHSLSVQPKSDMAVVQAVTRLGGHRLLGLSDGSRIELNTDTALRTLVNGEQRSVWLDRGEAFFEVAHRDGLPFVVHAGPRQITVLGTKFSVRRDGNKVTVSVLEGRVRVDDIEHVNAARSTVITAGDIALSEDAATLVTTGSQERVDDALSWRTGMLSFDQEHLSDIAAEFNRYNQKKIVVDDPAAAQIRIGGTFPAFKPGAFARLLHDAYGLEVEETGDSIRISHP